MTAPSSLLTSRSFFGEAGNKDFLMSVASSMASAPELSEATLECIKAFRNHFFFNFR